MNFQDIDASASPEVQVNENFGTIDYTSVYGKRQPVTTGLTWGYYGGRWGGFEITAGTLSLSNATNYVVVERATGVISTSTASTNWDNSIEYARVYKIVATGGAVSGTPQDHRAGPLGVFAPAVSEGLLQIGIGSPEDDLTLTPAQALYQTIEITGTLTAERDIFVPVTTPRTWTIFANTTSFGVRVINAGSPQAGVSIGVGKTAIVRATGSSVVRVTADV